MPDISEIDYSEDATVAAFRDYYRFLTTMYLDESLIQEPPDGEWPHLTSDRWPGFNKTEEVFSLLRRLPYVKEDNDEFPLGILTVPDGQFTNYAEIPPHWDGASVKESTELGNDGNYEIPPHIVGLINHRTKCPRFLLDTKLGVVYWPNCPGEIKRSGPEQAHPDPYGWEDYCFEDGSPLITDEKEAEWRASGGVWAIADFFAMLKFHFMELNFFPVGRGKVTDVWVRRIPRAEARVVEIRKAYQAHGWPDSFHKIDCIAALRLTDPKFP